MLARFAPCRPPLPLLSPAFSSLEAGSALKPCLTPPRRFVGTRPTDGAPHAPLSCNATRPPARAPPGSRQGNTLRGFRNLQSTRIVTFHRNDNIIHFMRASLFQMLHRDQLAGRLPPPVDSAASPSVLARSPAVRWHVLELATPNDEWAPHDMPLFLDGEWFNALGLITGALRGEDEVAAAAAAAKSAGQKDGADGAQRHALAGERLRALSSLFGGKAPTRSSGASTHQASASPQLPPQRAAAAESDPGAGAYTRML